VQALYVSGDCTLLDALPLETLNGTQTRSQETYSIIEWMYAIKMADASISPRDAIRNWTPFFISNGALFLPSRLPPSARISFPIRLGVSYDHSWGRVEEQRDS